MTAAMFLDHFRRIQAYLKEQPDVPEELRSAFARDTEMFRKLYSPEAFKKAVSEGAAIDTELEERITSTVILLNRDRARRRAG